jgi:hypothetical protein
LITIVIFSIYNGFQAVAANVSLLELVAAYGKLFSITAEAKL